MKHLRVVICADVESDIHSGVPSGLAADYPAPKEGSWVVRDFRSHTGGRRWRREYLVLLQPARTGDVGLALPSAVASSVSLLVAGRSTGALG